MFCPLLNCLIKPKNLLRWSPSSKSWFTDLKVSRISMKLPMTYEKMATPNSKMNAVSILSELFLGYMSPNPTVDREVNAK